MKSEEPACSSAAARNIVREPSARIVEVFSSIQGEGLHVGRRHIFVRLFGCNIRCLYCDTPESLSGNPSAKLETEPGSGQFESAVNPVGLRCLVGAVERLGGFPHDAVSVTGGEPLIQHDFLKSFLPQLRQAGFRIYLETNGTLPERLAQIIDLIDTVSMDIKLPSTLEGGREWWNEHEEFLRIAKRIEVFCKMALSPEANDSEIETALRMTASVSSEIPLVIQPVTPFGGISSAPSRTRIIEVFESAKKYLRDVRVIPQTHKMIGLR